ncbi:hypothetical protein ACFOWZ_45255 [Lentzea rhizosphaerae]|uniref:Uncharacterized protein n=1 Tax=Lentzea rhizosphaerae TaxID=2041025 RepID=A0ABV8C9Y1_9PSEU
MPSRLSRLLDTPGLVWLWQVGRPAVLGFAALGAAYRYPAAGKPLGAPHCP